jgi:hypothetical protein
VNNELNVSGRKRSWPGNIPTFTWSDWGRPRKTSVMTAGLRAEIWTRHLMNTIQECQPLDSNVR